MPVATTATAVPTADGIYGHYATGPIAFKKQ